MENGTPACSFVLEVDELSQGKVYTTFIPCEISGKFAEQTSVEVEAGDVLQIAGKWKYKSVVDPKSGAKVSKPVVSSWGVSQRIPASQNRLRLNERTQPSTQGRVTYPPMLLTARARRPFPKGQAS